MQELLKRLRSDCVITTVGDVMIDQWFYGESNRKTEEYGKSFDICDVKKEIISCGGAANVARHVASLGVKSSVLMGVTGDDTWGRNFGFLCSKSDIYPYVYRDPNRITTIKTRVIDKDKGCYNRFDRECCNPIDFLTVGIIKRRISDMKKGGVDVFIVSDYGKGVVTEEVVHELVETGKPVIVDLKYHAEGKYDGVTLLKPNNVDISESQMRVLSHIAPVVSTKGKRGMEMFREGKFAKHLGGWGVPVKDAVGAGDAVIAGIAIAMASGLKLFDSMKVGNLAGAASVMEEGTLTGVTLEKMEKVVENFDYRC